MNTMSTLVLGPAKGRRLDIYDLGVRFMIERDATGGAFSLVEHPLGRRALGAGVHTHSREDEYSLKRPDSARGSVSGSTGRHLG